uniref:RNase III domain-containing protein n=1 Tax=Oryza punctata TaxID=4537 RepID=A0A0E0JK01_ORYPU
MQQQQPAGAGFVADRDAARVEVERLLGGYSFRDGGALLEDALTHSVHPRDDDGGRARHQRLEFLGDAALGLAFSTIFYREDPALDQGDLSLLRSANVSTQKLGRVAVRRHLYPLLRRYNCAPQDHESVEGPYSGDPIEAPKVLADIVEAIVGAVYLDSKLDLEVLQKVAKLLCEPIITKKALLEDPESMLNELGEEHREDLESRILEWRKVANVVDDGREQAITTTGLGNGSEDEVGDQLRTIRIEEA